MSAPLDGNMDRTHAELYGTEEPSERTGPLVGFRVLGANPRRVVLRSARASSCAHCAHSHRSPDAAALPADFTQFQAGPAAAVLLADYGADVCKIEPPVRPTSLLHLRSRESLSPF